MANESSPLLAIEISPPPCWQRHVFHLHVVPVAQRFQDEILSMPMHGELTEDQIDHDRNERSRGSLLGPVNRPADGQGNWTS